MTDRPAPKGRGALLARLQKEKMEKELAPGPPEAEKIPPVSRGRAALLDEMKKQRLLREQAAVGAPKLEQPVAPSTSRSVEKLVERTEKLQVREEPESEAQPCHFRGESGTPIRASANYIRLDVEKDRGVFEYEVRFNPDVDAKSNRFKIVNAILGDLATTKVYDGDVRLYLPSKMHDGAKEFASVIPGSDLEVTVTFNYKRKQRLGECLHLYNVLFKRIMNILLFKRMGKNYFNPQHKHIVPQHKLEILPGYAVSVDEMEGGLMVCLDTQHRVIRTQTVYDIMHELHASNPRNFKESVQATVLGSSVLTKYVTRTYVIDDIDYTLSPKDTFQKVDGEVISFVEYYKRQHNVIINDVDQPMLIAKKPKKMPTRGEQDQMTCLVPELCFLTGLTDAMRSDFKVMKDVAVFTRVTPNQRMLSLRKYLDNVRNSPESQKILAGWGLKIAEGTTDIQARVLPQETVYFDPSQSASFRGGTDWSRACGENKVTGPIDIQNWIVFYTKRDERNAETFVNTIMRLAPNMGCFIANPKLVVLPDDRSDSYVTALRNNLSSEVQVCVFICPSLRTDRYSVIKKICCSQTAVASQVILSRTLSNPQKVRTIIHKIALQITCKLGGTLWSVKIPVSQVMVCGIDVYHGVGHQSVCGFVCNINSSMTRWYSEAVFQEREIGDFFKMCFRRALVVFKNAEGKYPDRIVFYRDGVGDGQLEQCKQYEIAQFQEVLTELKIPATITFMVIQKRISTRIYELKGPNAENPPAGTVVDSVVTRRNLYDFYLVPQSVRQGTVNPTHYIVLQNDGNFKPDHLQKLSYKLCHLYYNWSGTIRVPAPCQYAHKLAQLVGMYIKKEPCQALRDRLYYL